MKASGDQVVKSSDRFVPVLSRPHDSVLTKADFAKISTGKYKTTWKGCTLMKSPLDLVLYARILEELRPRTIFDFGTCFGGSSLWLADQAEALGLKDFKVVTFDREDMRSKPTREHPRIEFVLGDLFQLNECLPPKWLASLPHPWLLIEDAHANVYPLLCHLHVFGMQPGDYFFVDDTHPSLPNGFLGTEDFDKTGFGIEKYQEVRPFLALASLEYVLDTDLLDMFGFNGTQAANGILKRVTPTETANILFYRQWSDLCRADLMQSLAEFGHLVLRPEFNLDKSSAPSLEQVINKLGLVASDCYKGTKLHPMDAEGRCHISTSYDPLQAVPPHHELTYAKNSPDVIVFICITPPEDLPSNVPNTRGETTLCDSKMALTLLDPKVRQRLEKEPVIYRSTLKSAVKNPDLAPIMTWQGRLNVGDSVEEASAELVRRGYTVVHQSADELVYDYSSLLVKEDRLIAPDLSHFINKDTLAPKTYKLMWENDASAFAKDTAIEIIEAYGRSRLHFRWSKCAEVLIIDNRKVAHGTSYSVGTWDIRAVFGNFPEEPAI
mmetsp:Transcript_43970/g.74147  ORF Transcript_43970/g.74147 Transcript_43970/m.74147 type:complete len:551 (+) Transcript_43970:102-1754(+)